MFTVTVFGFIRGIGRSQGKVVLGYKLLLLLWGQSLWAAVLCFPYSSSGSGPALGPFSALAAGTELLSYVCFYLLLSMGISCSILEELPDPSRAGACVLMNLSTSMT